MEIFDQQTNVLQANISSKYQPHFQVSGLDAGKLLKIVIYACNVKGRSDSILLEAFTLKSAEKQTGLCVELFSFFWDDVMCLMGEWRSDFWEFFVGT